MFRVGVVATEAMGESGGSFTFQHEVLQTLFHLPAVPGIEWVVITPHNGVVSQLRLTSKSIQSVTISLHARDHKIALTVNWLRSHVRSLVLGQPFKDRAQRRSEFFERKLRFLKLSMLWYLGPHPYTQEIPYVLTVWDIQHRLQPWFPEVSNNGMWAQREASTTSHLQRAALLITGNSVGAIQISSTYSIPLDRIVVNPLPVPNDALMYRRNQKPVVEVIRSWRKEFGEFLIYPAQFWAHKNHKILLEALAHLASESQRPPKLVLTGSDKGNLDYIMDLATNLQIKDYVINLGFVDRADLLSLYSEAKALVFPSFFGPDNIPPLEAMAIGCPVLVTDDPGMREQLGSAAIYLSPTDPIAWANAIADIDRRPETRNNLITSGQQNVGVVTSAKYVKAVQDRIMEFKKIRETWATK